MTDEQVLWLYMVNTSPRGRAETTMSTFGDEGQGTLLEALRVGCPDIEVSLLPPMGLNKAPRNRSYVGFKDDAVVLRVDGLTFEAAAEAFQYAYNEGEHKK